MNPTKEQDAILAKHGVHFRLSQINTGHGDQKGSQALCEIIDKMSGETYIRTLSDNEPDAFAAGLALVPATKKPYATADAKMLAEAADEIASLKAQLAAATAIKPAKGGKKNAQAPETVPA